MHLRCRPVDVVPLLTTSVMAFPQIGPLAASLAVGYLIGSIPVASLLTRVQGADILNVGTRNPGAANVFREISRPFGAMVLALDALKGFVAVTMSSILGVEAEMVAAAGAAAIAGHWYPLFLRFKGGAGLATAIGGGIALAPAAGLVALGLGLATVGVIHNSGRAALVGYIGFIGLSVVLDATWQDTTAASLLVVMVFARTIVLRAW